MLRMVAIFSVSSSYNNLQSTNHEGQDEPTFMFTAG